MPPHPGIETPITRIRTPKRIGKMARLLQLPLRVQLVKVIPPPPNLGVLIQILNLTSLTCLLACERADGSCRQRAAEKKISVTCGTTKKLRSMLRKTESLQTLKPKPKAKAEANRRTNPTAVRPVVVALGHNPHGMADLAQTALSLKGVLRFLGRTDHA